MGGGGRASYIWSDVETGHMEAIFYLVIYIIILYFLLLTN